MNIFSQLAPTSITEDAYTYTGAHYNLVIRKKRNVDFHVTDWSNMSLDWDPGKYEGEAFALQLDNIS